VLLTFDTEDTLVTYRDSPIARPFFKRDKKLDAFWSAANLLISLGLLQPHRLLVDGVGQGSELILPCPEDDEADATNGEQVVGAAIQRLGEAILASDPREWLNARAASNGLQIIPVPAHRAAACHLVTAFRPRYRPRTFSTAKWLSRDDKWLEMAETFNAEAATIEGGEERRSATA
jgi:hypothetical protein